MGRYQGTSRGGVGSRRTGPTPRGRHEDMGIPGEGLRLIIIYGWHRITVRSWVPTAL